jgi:predicted amidohydrolase YtcJ
MLRNSKKEPTGVILDPFNNGYVRRQIVKRQRNRNANIRILERVLAEYRNYGITSVQDNTWFRATVANLDNLFRAGRLTCRFSCWNWGVNPLWKLYMALAPYKDPWFHRGLLKYVLDGTFSTHTAWLSEPYSDEIGNFGQGRAPNEIQKILISSVKKKRQAAFHAIGDRAVTEFINTCDHVQRAYPAIKDIRPRLEHAQLIKPEDIPRLKKLDILVSAQPSALAIQRNDLVLLGRERARWTYPYRSLLDEGVHLSFGSDAPSETTFNPLQVIHYAVNRESVERISPFEALRCYTLGSAYAEFREKEKGSITRGKLADMAVLSDDILSIDPQRIKDISVEMTIVGGKIVFNKNYEEV